VSGPTGAWPELVAAAGAGLLSSFSHCLGMCGPIVAGLSLGGPRRPPQAPRSLRASLIRLPLRSHPVVDALVGQLPYHLGRITTYGLIGAVMGATGAFVNVAGRLAGLSDAVAVGAGLLMVLLGLGAAGVSARLKALEARASGAVLGKLRRLLQAGPGRLYPLGLAFGFLPCGVSWTLFLGAAASGGPVPGLLMALAFGLGTVPGLLLVGSASALLGQRTRGLLYRAGGLLVAALGAAFALRGLGLLHAHL
jgi:sulfite exporter TauE/SafE